MTEDRTTGVRAAADRISELEEELEVSGDAVVDGDPLAQARAALHAWIDAMTGVVVTPALGRVTLIHGNGTRSTISSPELPFAMSAPMKAGRQED